MGSPSRGCFLTKLAHSFLSHLLSVFLPTGIFHLYFFSPINFSRHICSFLARTVLSVYTGLSPIFLFCTSLLFATSLFLCSPLETWHVDCVLRPMLLEYGILVIEVTVGLWPLSANTSLWPRLQLDGRSGRPGLTNRLVAPLLWGCFTGVSQGCLATEYILSIALVSLRRISGEKLISPCWTQWRVGSGWNKMKMNITMDPKNKKTTCGQDFKPGHRLWLRNTDKKYDYQLASISFGGVRRRFTASHQAITIYRRFKVSRAWFQGDWDRSSYSEMEPSWWSMTQKKNKTRVIFSSNRKKLVGNESQYSPNPKLLAWCHSLPWSSWHDWNRHTRWVEWAGSDIVKLVRRKDKGQEKDMNTLFFTFCNANLPKDIRKGYLRVKVDPYVPNPLHCFKCQKYGHGAQRCSSAAVCPKCALEHEGPCTNLPPLPQMRELWRGTSIVIKGLQRVEKGKRNPKGENGEKMFLPWCSENCTGDQLLVAYWRKTPFCVGCGQADGVLCCPDQYHMGEIWQPSEAKDSTSQRDAIGNADKHSSEREREREREVYMNQSA